MSTAVAKQGPPTSSEPARTLRSPLLRDPRIAPCALAIAYLVLLVARFPQLVGYENANSDYASAYVLADAISHGHTGPVVLGTQGLWVPLWYGLLTHGLSFHRVLWEISPAVLMLAAAALIGWTVARVASAAAGLLAFALIVVASPTVLVDFTAPANHNLIIPGTAVLGAYLLWLLRTEHSSRALIASAVGLSLLIGTFLASDELLALVGLVPFLTTALLIGVRTGRRRMLYPVAGLLAGSIVVAIITSRVMGALHFGDTPPPLALTRRLVPEHIKWLVQGLLHFGNGLGVAPHSSVRTILVIAAAVVTAAGLAATGWLGGRSLISRSRVRACPQLSAHTLFWATSLLCAAIAYVVTTYASYPQTERYFLVAVPAVAATAPLIANRTVPRLVVAAGASIVMAASIVSLLAGDERYVVFQGTDSSQAAQIEALAQAQHLGIGYAGYWDAANLDWITKERLHVYPLTDRYGPVEPMYENRVATWYRPRPHTPSYLLLAPGDDNLIDAVPPGLPKPARERQLGPVTVAIYPYDIAAYLPPAPN